MLIELLEKKESAWEFEINGNKRAANIGGFYSTRHNVIPFINGVIKGKWNPLAKRKLLAKGIKVDGKRKSLSVFQTILYELRDFQFDCLTYIIHKVY